MQDCPVCNGNGLLLRNPCPLCGDTIVRIVSYNVLSSRLARENEFPTCDPAALDGDARFALLTNHLESHTTVSALICLQELSLTWSARLHVFFAKAGYTFLVNNYAGKASGYMGVGLAYPTQAFELEEVKFIKIGDLLQANVEDQQDKSAEDIVDGEKPFDYWSEASKCSQVLLCVQLKPVGGEVALAVGTYHMPCVFGTPEKEAMMVVHAGLAAQEVQNLAKLGGLSAGRPPLPCVLCGDFNIKPGDPAYELLTRGTLDEASLAYPHTTEGVTWTPKLQENMRSAYAEFTGNEPLFTNCAQNPSNHGDKEAAQCLGKAIASYKKLLQNKSRSESDCVAAEEDFADQRARLIQFGVLNPIFQACLDYIFLCGEVTVTNVLALPQKPPDGVFNVLPTSVYPSDHLLIGATLNIEVPGLTPEQLAAAHALAAEAPPQRKGKPTDEEKDALQEYGRQRREFEEGMSPSQLKLLPWRQKKGKTK